MTIVKGQIDSLKKIREELNRHQIFKFNSVGELNIFLKNYSSEKQNTLDQVEQNLDEEIEALEVDLHFFQDHIETVKIEENDNLKKQLEELQNKYDQLKSKKVNILSKVAVFIQLKIPQLKKSKLKKDFKHILIEKTIDVERRIDKINVDLQSIATNRNSIINYRGKQINKELDKTKEVIDSLYPLITGAIGEDLVVNELKKLSDKNILFNDFSMTFDPPIYNKKEKDKIYSIQIDHLLVTQAGLFIIETKNWSKKSIARLDLRSPVHQINRTSFALYHIFNRSSKYSPVKFKKHHWGDKELPIRKLIVMINHKPVEKFKHVTVLTLKDLNRYVSYFDPIFDNSEVQRISNYLEEITNKKLKRYKKQNYNSF